MSEPATPIQEPRPRPIELRHGRAIVAGFGPVGRLVADKLEEAGLDVTIIELNLATIERQLNLDKTVVYGDARDPQVLHRARIEEADVLVIAIPDEEAALEACRVARRLHPELFIAARTNFLSKGMLCSQAGADAVVVEEVVTAEAMQRAVLRRLSGGKGPGDDGEERGGDERAGEAR